MTTVYLYAGEGTFMGAGEFQWDSPKVGDTHKFILFVAQEVDEPQGHIAFREIERFGFAEAHIGVGKSISVEVLNESSMQGFRRHYEGALAEGCSIVWYP